MTTVTDLHLESTGMIQLPPVKGELTRRVVNNTYANRYAYRLPAVDWAAIKELRYMWEHSYVHKDYFLDKNNEPEVTFWGNEIKEMENRFKDIFNEELPEQIRMQHADIMFSRVFSYVNQAGMKINNFHLDQFVSIALKAGLT